MGLFFDRQKAILILDRPLLMEHGFLFIEDRSLLMENESLD